MDEATHLQPLAARAQRYDDTRTLLAELMIDESSSDGVIHVRVNAAGALTALKLTDDASGRSGTVLAEQIMATLRRAQSRIPEATASVLRDVLGVDDPVTESLSEAFTNRFSDGDSASASPGFTCPPAPMSRPDTDDEYFQGNLLRE